MKVSEVTISVKSQSYNKNNVSNVNIKKRHLTNGE